MTIAFVSHGGGPLPLLADVQHLSLLESFAELRVQLPAKPSVIVVVSAHWEADGIEVNGAAGPPLLFDYHGFPAVSYQYRYDAPGSPSGARALVDRLVSQGLSARLQFHRGWDHGVFVPLKLLYPGAQVPVLQLSLDRSLSPALHWHLGVLLGQWLPDNALLLGSGFSFHNLPAFFAPPSASLLQASNAFARWLDRHLVDLWHETDTERALCNWPSAPAARINHPREEHLLPLLVCAAAANRPAAAQRFDVMRLPARHYVWR